jgi:hypothetical protein
LVEQVGPIQVGSNANKHLRDLQDGDGQWHKVGEAVVKAGHEIIKVHYGMHERIDQDEDDRHRESPILGKPREQQNSGMVVPVEEDHRLSL